MVPIRIEHQCDFRSESVDRTVALVHLGHQPIALNEVCGRRRLIGEKPTQDIISLNVTVE